MASNYYDGLIWTNHVLQRLKERGISQEMASRTFHGKDRVLPGKEAGSYHYQKRFEGHTVTLVVKRNEKHEWVVLSSWVDPPLPGTEDYRRKQVYREYRNGSFWKKVWMSTLRQLGLIKY